MKNFKLQDIAKFINGYAFKPSDWQGTGIKIIRIQNLTDSSKKFNRTNTDIPAKYRVQKGDILVSWSATLDIFEWNDDEDAWLNQHIFKVEHDGGLIDKYYLKYALKQTLYELEKYSHGSTMKHVVRSDFLNHKIPLVSLPAQKKIVRILDTAGRLRQKRKEQLKLLDDYLKSVFVEMFGDPVRNEKNIAQRKISDVGEVVTGNTPSRQKKEYYGDFIEWIKSDNINTPEFVLTKAEEFLSKIGAEVGRIASKGSILVTCIAGSPDCIGNSAIANREVAFNQQINAFVPNKDIKTEFFFAQLYICKQLVQQASTESMKGMVSKSRFSEIKIIVPNLNEQVEFVRVFNQIPGMRKKMRVSLDEMDNHFNALMQRAFSGEIS